MSEPASGSERVDAQIARTDASAFVLDLDSNPHPRMLAEAIDARADARSIHFDPWDPATSYWHGFLAAMAAATGCAQEDLVAWVERHEADEVACEISEGD